MDTTAFDKSLFTKWCVDEESIDEDVSNEAADPTNYPTRDPAEATTPPPVRVSPSAGARRIELDTVMYVSAIAGALLLT